ncbi:MAG: hypothetical protein C0412_12740 [Flavobacterium sp.]|nr:hypothetical protein [Flavobacterium sp.]
MGDELNPMDKFRFLLGTWEMDYYVPKSSFGDGDSGKGEGTFKRILNNRYVTFNYYAKYSSSEGSAHAIFAWDEKSKIYRFWWFENSGAFSEASCNFISENILYLNWHNSLLVQSFQLLENGKIILQMKSPLDNNNYELVLEVVFTKKQ